MAVPVEHLFESGVITECLSSVIRIIHIAAEEVGRRILSGNRLLWRPILSSNEALALNEASIFRMHTCKMTPSFHGVCTVGSRAVDWAAIVGNVADENGSLRNFGFIVVFPH